jgi:hypothetical protein
LEVDRITVGLLPWDEVNLLDVEGGLSLPAGKALGVEARRVRVSGSSDVSRGTLSRSIDRIVADGVRSRVGPIQLVEGSLEITRRGSSLDVRGWASGAEGGRLDLRGEVTADPPHLGRIQLYLADLGFVPAGLSEPLTLSGAVVVRRLGQETDRIGFNLHLKGRAPAGPSWRSVRADPQTERLNARIEGVIERVAGRFTPDSGLRIRGELRVFQVQPVRRALHGPFSGSFRLAGTADDLRGSLGLNGTDLRIRFGDRLDKKQGVPAGFTLDVRSENVAGLSLDGEVRIGSLRARGSADSASQPLDWRVRTGWCPVEELLELVPLLRTPGLDGVGRIRASARSNGDPYPAVQVELADLSIPLGESALRLPHATTVELAGETLDLAGTVRPRGAGAWEAAVHANAEHLRLDPLLALLGTGVAPSTMGFEKAAASAVRWLHARSFLLRGLTLRPALLEIGKLSGLGFSERGIRLEAGLEDRRIRVELSTQDGAQPHTLCLDLKSWMPQVSDLDLDSGECLHPAPPSGS